MNVTAEGWFGRVLAALLSVAVATVGCGVDSASDDLPTPELEHLADIEAELAGLVSDGLASEMPPPMSREERELIELTHYRRRLADDMRQSVHAALTPLAIAASVFAINGPVDLLLAVVPSRVLGNAFKIAKKGIRTRTKSRRSQQLVALHRELSAALSAYGQEFMSLAKVLKTTDRKALKIIHRRVGDDKIIYTLMRRRLDGAADVQWIARKLEQGKFDRTFVRRYTFGSDIIADITTHDANISWRTLQRVIDGEEVSQSARNVLQGKMAGLMGERLARERVLLPAYAQKMLKLEDGDKLVAVRGLRYSGGSLDIAAYSEKGQAMFAEVKNWGTSSWENNWQTVVTQLRKHNRGIEESLAEGGEKRTVAGKMLIVTRQGYYRWAKDRRDSFEAKVEGLGWQLDFIDGNDIKDFRAVIDSMR